MARRFARGTAAARRLWRPKVVLSGLAVLASFATCASAGPHAGAEPGPPPAVGPGLKPVPGIAPPLLRLGSGGAARCVQVVEVVDAQQACEAQRCLQVFPSRRTQVLAAGQRALLASSCAPAGGRAELLWGSKSVLVLQPERSGEGLWSAAAPGIELQTEASHGRLSVERGGYRWKEAAD